MTYKSLAYLPNKKIWAFVALVLMIFTGWFYYSRHQNEQLQYVADQKDKGLLTVITDQKNSLDADTDNDGLKDWEEALWKTDQKNPDTDSDGVSDGDEVKQGRDPLKPGPNDKITAKVENIVKENELQNQEQETITAGYAKKFLTSYLLLKQAKGDLTAEDKKQLVDSFMADIKPLKVEDKYKLTDLKITQNNSKEAIKKYADEMKKIFITDSHKLVNEPNVFEDLIKVLKNKSDDDKYQADIKLLDYSVENHNELIKNIIILTVPANLKENHLETINGLNNVAFAIKTMTEASVDPIKAMMARSLYDGQLKRAYDALNSMQNIFNKNGIHVF